MNTVDVLKGAKALLLDMGWTQGAYSRGLGNRRAKPTGPKALCFCGLGAIQRLTGDTSDHHRAARALNDTVPYRCFPSFNDAKGRTLPEVLAKFDEAIAAEEARQSVGVVSI